MVGKERSQNFSRQEIEALGYNWAVVGFFKLKRPDLLNIMWGSDLPLYESILTNTITDQELAKHVDWVQGEEARTGSNMEKTGNSIQAIEIMREFRTKYRPPTEQEVHVRMQKLSNGKCGYLTAEEMEKWREYPDPVKKETVFVYQGYDLDNRRHFSMPWVMVDKN